jgi:hypothetical protein
MLAATSKTVTDRLLEMQRLRSNQPPYCIRERGIRLRTLFRIAQFKVSLYIQGQHLVPYPLTLTAKLGQLMINLWSGW